MSITICDTHLVRTVRYLSLTFEPVYSHSVFLFFFAKKEDLISSNFLYSNNVSYIRGGKISAPP